MGEHSKKNKQKGTFLMREEFSQFILCAEQMLPAEVKFFVRSLRLEVERIAELEGEDITVNDNAQIYPHAVMEQRLERAFPRVVCELAAAVYERKATRLREYKEVA